MRPKLKKPKIISLNKIWNYAEHNALTDLIYFQDHWYCVFRESTAHVHGLEGIIRLIKSSDALKWQTEAVFIEESYDLRDPKLSITPDGRLMLLVGATNYIGKRYISRQSHVAFSEDGHRWGPLIPVLEIHEWLWRLTWHNGKAYGAAYKFSNPHKITEEWEINFYESEDGLHFHHLAKWEIPGWPNESTVQFIGSMAVALVRRDHYQNNHSWMGTSFPPYTDWDWKETQVHLGGPNFVVLPNLDMWAGGRILHPTPYGLFEKTVLAKMNEGNIIPSLWLPSWGDCSYPGMFWHHDYLWMTYYSSHEDKTSIYMAKIQLY